MNGGGGADGGGISCERLIDRAIYPRRVWEVLDTNVRLLAFFIHLQWLRRRIERDPTPYVDAALIMPDAETDNSAFSAPAKKVAAAAA